MLAWLRRLPPMIVGDVTFAGLAVVFLVISPPDSTLARFLWALLLLRCAWRGGVRWARRASPGQVYGPVLSLRRRKRRPGGGEPLDWWRAPGRRMYED